MTTVKKHENGSQWRQRRPQKRGGRDALSLEIAIKRLGLGRIENEDDADAEATGTLFGAELTVRRDRKGKRFQWSIAAKHPGIPDDLELISEGGLASVTKIVRGDARTGDKTFDDKIVVRGNETNALALLSESVRHRAVRWISQGARVSKNTVSWSGKLEGKSSELLGMARALGQLAADLSLTGLALHRRLLANALKDPVLAVRARNLRALATEAPTALTNRKLLPIINQIAGAGLSDLVRPVVVALLTVGSHWLRRLTQASLLLLLEDDTHRLAAIARLADSGDQLAVAEISRVARGLPKDSELREASEGAVARILERTGAVAGALSVATAKSSGELSVHND
jgi:hypothetical protein